MADETSSAPGAVPALQLESALRSAKKAVIGVGPNFWRQTNEIKINGQIEVITHLNGVRGNNWRIPNPADPNKGGMHWCGIFALWAHKFAGTPNIGTWRQGVGISAVAGFRELSSTEMPMPADIGFVETLQHHVLIRRAYPRGNSLAFDTVEGNSSPGSVVATREGSDQSRFKRFYRARSLDMK